MQRLSTSLAAIAAALLVAACGGKSDPEPAPLPDPTAAVPAEASESSAGLVKYLTELAAAPADDKEPVSLDTFMPKTPDDTEPEPVG